MKLKPVKKKLKIVDDFVSTDKHSSQGGKKNIFWVYSILLVVIFAVFIFFRFYQMSTWAELGYDQLDSAWGAERILFEHKYPLIGMNSKGNSGLYTGPLYYYFAAIFYFFTNYDPIASPLMASFAAIVGFISLYICVNKLHGKVAALVAVFIYTFSMNSILADRIQWTPNFIPPISLMLFYCLYKVIRGTPKYLIWVGLLIGLTFHLHFIVIFFVGMTIAVLPFFPRTRQTLVYGLVGIAIVLVFLLPNFIHEFQSTRPVLTGGATMYASSYFHGFHFRRFVQLTADAFIDVEKILSKKFFGNLIYFLPVLYSILLWFSAERKKIMIVSYLVFVWLIVPWIVFTGYSGEITDYYFSSFRFIVIMMCAYVIARALQKNWFTRILAIVFLGYYAFNTISVYSIPQGNMIRTKQSVIKTINAGEKIPYVEGNLDSYLFYIYTTILPNKRK